MNSNWLKSTTLTAVLTFIMPVQATPLNWQKTCTDGREDHWPLACSLSEDPQACLMNNLLPVFDHTSELHLDPNRQLGDGHQNQRLNTIPGCDNYDFGEGSFSQYVRLTNGHDFALGGIPSGKAQVKIKLSETADVDLQLHHGTVPLVAKDNGLINASSSSVVDYQGIRITHSGFYGDQFIHLSGVTFDGLSLQLGGQQAAFVAIDYQWGIAPSLGALLIPNRQVFNDLAGRSAVPGAIGIREIKFIIKDINGLNPSLYFIHGNNVPLHIDFAYDVLDWYPGLNFDQAYRAFSNETYFLDGRTHLAGSVLAHDNYIDAVSGKKGLYTLQWWPTDPVAAELIIKAHQLIKAHMPLADNQLVYFPASDTQMQIYQNNSHQFIANEVNIIDSENLFANVDYTAMNLGEAYGTLRLIAEGGSTPSVNDVAIFTYVPNDLAHVAGIITDTTQTPLSHINLKAKQNNTPNAYIENAATNPVITPLLNQLVHFKVTHDGFQLQPATQAEVDSWLAAVRPSDVQIPESDLSITGPTLLENLGHDDWVSFGAKAANVAELAQVLEPGSYPVGYAIPFAMYDEFMALKRCQGVEDDGITPNGQFRKLCDNSDDPSGQSLYQQIQHIMMADDFINSPDERYQQLKDFRKEVKKSEVPDYMSDTLESIRYFWDPDGDFTHSIRLRSSTNNEDLAGFNGAGLYESNTHHPDEGDVAESVKKVWASLWTARAFEERRFYRIDHFKTYMGVLAHLSYGDEQVNGVAVTKNIYDRNWEGYYVNTQYGEISVTNPEPITTSEGQTSSIPDEFLLTKLTASETEYRWIQQYIRRSNVETVYDQPVPTENVLLDEEVIELRTAMQRIQSHFKNIYAGDENFAMDIEFKITRTDDGSRGHLEIKQARPWID